MAITTLVVGCQTTKIVSITSDPGGAMIKVNGVERGVTPLVNERLVFEGASSTLDITASKRGFKDRTVSVTRDSVRDLIELRLPPESKRVTINVGPVPAILAIDGRAMTPEPVSTLTQEVEFFVDARGNFVPRTVTADRPGYRRAEASISFTDNRASYQILLEPVQKNLNITTDPPGSEVSLDGRSVGHSPVQIANVPFELNTQGEWQAKKIRVTRPGYDPVEKLVSWDDGQTDYLVQLLPRAKTVNLRTTPGGATVEIDGKQLRTDAAGNLSLDLTFPPIDPQGTLKSYPAKITRKTAESEWYPQEIVIGWDDAKKDYTVNLREILTMPLPMLTVGMERGDDGWVLAPKPVQTIAARAVTEGTDRQSPVKLASVPAGSTIDSIALSPDGSRLVFSVISGEDRAELKSQLRMIRTDGTGGISALTDGQTIDLCPSFSPDGRGILFSSNRAGRKGGRQLNVWSINADGTGGVRRLMAGADTSDLWPQQDSDPEPRIFYEAYVDGRADPRIYMTQLGTVFQTDLTQIGGSQPRISPRNDTLVFTAVHESSGKRDLYRMSDKGGAVENLTSSSDSDETDPSWSRDGTRVAFASDRGIDGEGRANYDIWVLDMKSPATPIQITTNGSVDDRPIWDPAGEAIYFRSNRGGEWGIWRIAVPKQ